EVAPGDPPRRGGKIARHAGEDVASVIAMQLRTRERTGRQGVQIAVAVVITPRGRTVPIRRQTRANVCERAVVVIAVNARQLRAERIAVARDEDVEVTVVVVITPGRVAVLHAGDGRGEFSETLAARDQGRQKWQSRREKEYGGATTQVWLVCESGALRVSQRLGNSRADRQTRAHAANCQAP